MSAFFYKLAQDVAGLPIVGPIFGEGMAITAWYRFGVEPDTVFGALVGNGFPLSDTMNGAQWMICMFTSVGVVVGGTAAIGLTIYYGPTVYKYTKKGCIYTYNSAYDYFYPPSETPVVETVKVMPVETPASKFAGVSPNFDPLEQFDVQPVADTGFLGYFTNLALFLVAGLLLWSLLIALFFLTVKTRYDLVLLVLFRLVCSVAKENISIKRQQYTVTIFYLFLTIFAANLIGLVPYTFTPTSSFVVTFFLALSHFNGVNLIGVLEHIWRIFNLFLPSGVPVPGAPFLTLIEIISYLARVFSLSIRLFANMMSGHALLKILSGFSWSLLRSNSPLAVVAIVPWVTVTAIFCLELLIAFLQAYVFIILLAIYINDAVNLH